MRGGLSQVVRNHVASLVFGLPPVRRTVANTLAELSIGYPDSPLTRRGPHARSGPAPGERAPVREVRHPVGAGASPRFALFAAPDEGSAGLVARYPDLLEPETRAPFDDGGIWLVRPDGYVAVADARGAWAGVGEYLARLAGAGWT
jgi:hypothetical protein